MKSYMLAGIAKTLITDDAKSLLQSWKSVYYWEIMDADRIMKLLESNAKLITEHMQSTQRTIDEISKKRNETFRCEQCKKWKKRQISERTLEANSDDERDLCSVYNNTNTKEVSTNKK